MDPKSDPSYLAKLKVNQDPTEPVRTIAMNRITLRLFSPALMVFMTACLLSLSLWAQAVERFRVEGLKELKDPGDQELVHRTIRIVNEDSRVSNEVETVDLITRIDQMFVFSSKLVIVGEVDNKAAGIGIYDIASGRRLDFIVCYHPIVSPDHKLIVYEAYYPRFSPPDVVQSHLLLAYDLSKSAKLNRITEETLNEGHKNTKLSHDLWRGTNVGLPVYPHKVDLSVYVKTPEEPHGSFGRTTLQWTKSSQGLVLLDQNAKRYQLVDVNLSAGTQNPVIRTRSLPSPGKTTSGRPGKYFLKDLLEKPNGETDAVVVTPNGKAITVNTR
jgi:hypothetical protein